MCAAEFSAGHKAVVIVLPTGAGKTRLSGEMIVRHLAKVPTGKVLFCAHREELVSQTFDAFEKIGLKCGVVMASPTRIVNPFRKIQIASTQTLLARNLIIDDITLFIMDECHHYMSAKWSALGAQYKSRGVRIVGLTATPIRGDGIGLGNNG